MSAHQDPRDLDQLRQIDSVADEFDLAFHGGSQPRIEDYLPRVPADVRSALLNELLRIDLEWAARRGETVRPLDYLTRFPADRKIVSSALQSAGVWSPELADTADVSGAIQRTTVVPAVPTCPGRFGRFELLRRLGTGGFGTVFLANDTQLGRQVALKIPRESEGNKRFLAEARAAAKLQHPNIVTVYDSGTVDGNLFIVCSLVDGTDFATEVESRPHSLKQLIGWIRDAARALAYSHAQGVVHRDIKPGNLLVSQEGQIFVADFGLARRVEESSSLTADGTVLGTPAYMSPEQAAGLTAEIGPHSDQYSLGVVLYEILTGRRPFRGNVREVLQKVIHSQPPTPRQLHPKVPAELEAICLKAMAKDPSARYPSMAAFADDLERWLQLRSEQAASRNADGFSLGKLARARWFQAACAVVLLGGSGVVWIGMKVMSPLADPGRSDARQAGLLPQGNPVNPDLVRPRILNADQPEAAAASLLPAADVQKQTLVSAFAVDRSWELPSVDASAPCVLTVIEADETGAKLTAILADATDVSRREIWTGGIRVMGSDRNSDGVASLATFAPLNREHELPSNGLHQLSFAVADANRFVWRNANASTAIRQVPRPATLPTVDEARRQLIAAISPGRVWEGTYQQSGEATRPVEVIFTEFRDDGQHVRAIVQSLDDPFSMAPFLGTVDFSASTLLAGHPIHFTRSAASMGATDVWEIFGAGYQQMEMNLGLSSPGQLRGTVYRAKLLLKPGQSLDYQLSRADQWRAALQPDSAWTGVLTKGDRPPQRIRLTLAEVRDEHRYVRMLFEGEEDPHLFSVCEGALNLADTAIDGYALSAIHKYRAASSGEDYHGLFPTQTDGRHALRLSSDGNDLLLLTQAGERAKFRRDGEANVVPLERAKFQQAWLQVCAPGREWRGVLHNKKYDQRSEVIFSVSKAADNLGNLEAVIALAERPAARIRLTGTLRADNDVDVNAYALKFAKASTGQGPSILFGQGRDGQLHFRLSTDGQKLVGMAREGSGRGWEEFLSLESPPPQPDAKN